VAQNAAKFLPPEGFFAIQILQNLISTRALSEAEAEPQVLAELTIFSQAPYELQRGISLCP